MASVYVSLMRGGCVNWLLNQQIQWSSYLEMQIDIHHVFPRAWCEKEGVDDVRRESARRQAVRLDDDRRNLRRLRRRTPPRGVPSVLDGVDAVKNRMAQWSTGGVYLNFAKRYKAPRAIFGAETHRRLQQVTRAYDPADVIRSHHAIKLP
jgi:hypothetical protein